MFLDYQNVHRCAQMVVYLIVEDQRRVDVLLVLWVG